MTEVIILSDGSVLVEPAWIHVNLHGIVRKYPTSSLREHDHNVIAAVRKSRFAHAYPFRDGSIQKVREYHRIIYVPAEFRYPSGTIQTRIYPSRTVIKTMETMGRRMYMRRGDRMIGTNLVFDGNVLIGDDPDWVCAMVDHGVPGWMRRIGQIQSVLREVNRNIPELQVRS